MRDPLRPQPGSPTPPIAIAGGSRNADTHLATNHIEVDERLVAQLQATGAEVIVDAGEGSATVADASRDWWPLAMIWATEGEVAGRASAVVRPTSADQVAAVLTRCNEARVPVTTAGGRSGVCGASVPLFGGVLLDLTAMSGIVAVDDKSMIVDVLPGTFGEPLEAELQQIHGITIGHWPQSMTLATVGGWLACRGAGQYSTRYGKIEDIVVGLDVALADGSQITCGDQPAQAVGPDLTQLFVGSEGTLGVITAARLLAHPKPAAERRAAFVFDSFEAGLDVCRGVVQRGATPAVLRLHDRTEAMRYDLDHNVLFVLDEGDAVLIDATMRVVDDEARDAGAIPLGHEPVDAWFEHRNDVSALEKLIGRGWVVDTMEVAGRWASLSAIHESMTAALQSVEGTVVASCHQSHAYVDGACLYFTFAGQVDADRREGYYRDVWDRATRELLAHGGALSHHHGVGLNRGRFVAASLGPAFETLVTLKSALDPNGILNPGKLGLPSPFGEVPWP